MRPIRMVWLLPLLVVSAGVTASAAQGASAPVHVAPQDRLAHPAPARVGFTLGAGWSIGYGDGDGKPTVGGYRRATPIRRDAAPDDDISCILEADTEASSARHPRLGDVGWTVVRRGRAGRIGRWVIGASDRRLEVRTNGYPALTAAAATLPVPRGAASRRVRGVLVETTVSWSVEGFGAPDEDGFPTLSPTRRQRRICRDRYLRFVRHGLPATMASMRVRTVPVDAE